MNGAAPKKPRGCFFYGCITGFVLLLLMVAGLLLGFLYFKRMFENFTDTKPLPLPVAQLSAEEAKKLHDRLDAFNKALQSHRPATPLELSADDINGWIATTPNLQAMTGRVYVTIEGDQLKGQLSVPMRDLHLPIFKDRYLNGSVTFKLFLRDGNLHVTAQDITVKGSPIPSVYMDQIRQTDFARDAMNNPDNKAALERYEEIKIENGKLIVIPKKPESDPGQPPTLNRSEAETNK